MASRFSSSVWPSAARTWNGCVLPTRHTAGVPAFTTAASVSSFSADRPGRLVIPKAASVGRILGAASKNALSVGFAPGHPPST